ncbi:uncharacterized protein L201_000435 [Kwoniella dendrophila CBS 6074]|uniref:Major facilitator superfamily (MFS) profile domain-containing protein n=1 Tax=Kwoniella dendrophila CBS 6074 TaxID=1295534 RepID=A0AAX4JJH5_9TREE
MSYQNNYPTIDDKAEINHVEAGDMDLKHDAHHHSSDQVKHGDRALKYVGEERIELTEEDNVRIRRKTDKRILSILMWVYFLQIFDKTLLGYANNLGMSTTVGLHGTQYQLLSMINAIVQLAWQPFSSYLLVRVPARPLMTGMVFCWGLSQACMAASSTFGGLLACRALLGLFEAGCLPLFSLLTVQWYRRSEQPLRVAAWYSTNGMATIVAALISFGLGHVKSPHIHNWQLIFIISGIITVLTAPVIWFMIDSDVASARFFDEDEKAKAIERLRANNTGTGTNEFKWKQVIELFIDPKTYLWLALTLCINVGAAVTTYFGPTLIGSFGFSKNISSLLNMPFGFLQIIAIMSGCYAATKFKIKSALLAVFNIIVIIGLVLLYVENTRGKLRIAVALVGYYLLAFLFGCNPMVVAWIAGNTAGQTKKATIMSVFNAASAVGNIVGPAIFSDKDKPHYIPGLKATLGIFCAMLACIAIQFMLLIFFNKQRQNQRVKNGKPKFIKDTSMENKYQAYGSEEHNGTLGQNALLDLTDFKNDEFVYVY